MSQLFHSLDASPFIEKVVDEDSKERVVSRAQQWAEDGLGV